MTGLVIPIFYWTDTGHLRLSNFLNAERLANNNCGIQGRFHGVAPFRSLEIPENRQKSGEIARWTLEIPENSLSSGKSCLPRGEFPENRLKSGEMARWTLEWPA